MNPGLIVPLGIAAFIAVLAAIVMLTRRLPLVILPGDGPGDGPGD